MLEIFSSSKLEEHHISSAKPAQPGIRHPSLLHGVIDAATQQLRSIREEVAEMTSEVINKGVQKEAPERLARECQRCDLPEEMLRSGKLPLRNENRVFSEKENCL